MISFSNNNSIILNNKVPYHFDILGGNQPPALRPHLLDDNGHAVPLVSGPVRPLTLPVAVGHGMALGALSLLEACLATLGADGKVPFDLWHLQKLYQVQLNLDSVANTGCPISH